MDYGRPTLDANGATPFIIPKPEHKANIGGIYWYKSFLM